MDATVLLRQSNALKFLLFDHGYFVGNKGHNEWNLVLARPFVRWIGFTVKHSEEFPEHVSANLTNTQMFLNLPCNASPISVHVMSSLISSK
ncbi:hypothetical protein KIN20_011738 [Parelaphostrongylus tenuis]|uniref:Uncharacterized protein n=1 Tax=Parelaphostrongylus tenuis TaxID=148309 RepID=A0AAD5MDB8_PARTN|nr:hypothetical protein KIN20_011738 [Parelaphostrongylus tenuis]